VAGLGPLAATAAAFWISVSNDLIPACNPFIDGCVSISRAGRHGLANHVFRAIVLPSAVLQALTWLLCAPWLRGIGASGPTLRWLPWLGVAAAAFLILYGTFLGTEGDAYRWMRRYGIVGYFGGTFLCMLIAGGHAHRLAAVGRRRFPFRLEIVILGMLGVTLLMGLANVFVPQVLGDEALKNRLENVLEWHAGLLFTFFFLVLAALWRHTGYRSSILADE
jgi:hypothetical protein